MVEGKWRSRWQLILLALFLVLIPTLGLLGAIIARVVNHAILIVFNSVYFARVLKRSAALPPPDPLPEPPDPTP